MARLYIYCRSYCNFFSTGKIKPTRNTIKSTIKDNKIFIFLLTIFLIPISAFAPAAKFASNNKLIKLFIKIYLKTQTLPV